MSLPSDLWLQVFNYSTLFNLRLVNKYFYLLYCEKRNSIWVKIKAQHKIHCYVTQLVLTSDHSIKFELAKLLLSKVKPADILFPALYFSLGQEYDYLPAFSPIITQLSAETKLYDQLIPDEGNHATVLIQILTWFKSKPSLVLNFCRHLNQNTYSNLLTDLLMHQAGLINLPGLSLFLADDIAVFDDSFPTKYDKYIYNLALELNLINIVTYLLADNDSLPYLDPKAYIRFYYRHPTLSLNMKWVLNKAYYWGTKLYIIDFSLTIPEWASRLIWQLSPNPKSDLASLYAKTFQPISWEISSRHSPALIQYLATYPEVALNYTFPFERDQGISFNLADNLARVNTLLLIDPTLSAKVRLDPSRYWPDSGLVSSDADYRIKSLLPWFKDYDKLLINNKYSSHLLDCINASYHVFQLDPSKSLKYTYTNNLTLYAPWLGFLNFKPEPFALFIAQRGVVPADGQSIFKSLNLIEYV